MTTEYGHFRRRGIRLQAPGMKILDLPDETATAALAARIAAVAVAGDVIGLSGPLGAG